ncbi:MAG: hypothetical protein ACP5OB_07655, partial [Candidatus Ratteibacteria bacterium]
MRKIILIFLPIVFSIFGETYEEGFENLGNIKEYKGYKCENISIEIEEKDTKEGKAVKVIWKGLENGIGVGGIEKRIPETDLTGKNFTIWIKPVKNVIPTFFFALYDNSGRVSFNAWHNIKIGEWNKIIIKIGEKGSSNYFEKSKDDFSKINKIHFYFNS